MAARFAIPATASFVEGVAAQPGINARARVELTEAVIAEKGKSKKLALLIQREHEDVGLMICHGIKNTTVVR